VAPLLVAPSRSATLGQVNFILAALAVPAEQAEKLRERACELIGYSIHPPFMGYVDDVHPRRLLRPQVR
jgi:hypothetical protein